MFVIALSIGMITCFITGFISAVVANTPSIPRKYHIVPIKYKTY